MADDDAYASFLDKANSQADDAPAPAKAASQSASKAVNTAIPATLPRTDALFISETESPFHPVALKHGHKHTAVDPKVLAKSLGRASAVVEDVTASFDPRGQYKDVLDAVKAAGNGTVRVFRFATAGARAEYYIVSCGENGDMYMGQWAEAVES